MGVAPAGSEFYPSNVGDGAWTCFLCSQRFDASDGEPAVYWVTAGEYIFFHGDCAGSFVLRLARDAWEVQRDAGDGKFPLTAR